VSGKLRLPRRGSATRARKARPMAKISKNPRKPARTARNRFFFTFLSHERIRRPEAWKPD
jgi:hypothetical protein